MKFKQWNVVRYGGSFIGLLVDPTLKKILWTDGVLTNSFGPSTNPNAFTIIDILFDFERMFENLPNIQEYKKKYRVDNLTYIEILDGYRKHLNE